MRVVTRQQALNFLRQQKTPIEVMRAFGDYQQDPSVGVRTSDVYDESTVFYAGGGKQGGVQLTEPTLYKNNTSFSVYPFVIGTAQGSVQIVPPNLKRVWVLIQNQCARSNF